MHEIPNDVRGECPVGSIARSGIVVTGITKASRHPERPFCMHIGEPQ